MLTHIPVPFALGVRASAPGVIRWEECNAGQLRAMWMIVCLLGVMVLAVLVVQLARYGFARWDPRVIIVLIMSPPALGVMGYALYRRYRVPLRQLEYEVATRAFRVRTYCGEGANPDWWVLRPGEWSLRVHAVEVRKAGWKHGVHWEGHAAVVYLGTDRFVVCCSKRREKVLAYVKGLPMHSADVVEDPQVLRGAAWLGGDLVA